MESYLLQRCRKMSVFIFLRNMQNAFTRYDLELVLDLYEPPLAIIHEHRTVLVDTREELSARALQSLNDMKQAGITLFEIKLVSEIAVGSELTMVRYESTRHYRNGTKDLPAYEACVVRETKGKMKITASINPRSRWRENAGLPLTALGD